MKKTMIQSANTQTGGDMTDEFKAGDKVRWNSPQGVVHGKVKKKLTSPTHIKGHEVAASKEDPQYLVRSDNGGKAAHKPSALRRRKKATSSSTRKQKSS
jgi:hypothetical protein